MIKNNLKYSIKLKHLLFNIKLGFQEMYGILDFKNIYPYEAIKNKSLGAQANIIKKQMQPGGGIFFSLIHKIRMLDFFIYFNKVQFLLKSRKKR